MTTTVTKVTENRLRRVANRQGLVLHKSRARDTRHRLYGKYQLTSKVYTAREAKAILGIDAARWYTGVEIARLLDEPIDTPEEEDQ